MAVVTETLDPNSIISGLVTRNVPDLQPVGLRVQSIKWDSGFRGSGLRPGDRIIAVDGKPFAGEDLGRFLFRAIGQYAENQGWALIGAKDGQEVVLTVTHLDEERQIKGRLKAERMWCDADGRKYFGPGGPEIMGRDGFDSAWTSWLERLVSELTQVLDNGWFADGFDNRRCLTTLMGHQERVDLLRQKFPGAFADSIGSDWENAVESCRGTLYSLTDADLAYRRAGEQLAAELAQTAATAFDAFVASSAPQTIAPFPIVDPYKGDLDGVKGKTVVLPPIAPRDWIMECKRPFLVSGSDGDGRYFISMSGPTAIRLSEASRRYEKSVNPVLPQNLEVVARITGNPKMVVMGHKAVSGLEAELLAARVGGQMFVDLTREENGVSLFAGERELRRAGGAPPDDASLSPSQVMGSFIEMVKTGDETGWRNVFADWKTVPLDDGRVLYYPVDVKSEPMLNANWADCRKLVCDRVYDMRVVHESKPRSVLNGTEFPAAPRIDEALCVIDHIGLFSGEYRSFKNLHVNRVWALQRLNEGPWRVVYQSGV